MLVHSVYFWLKDELGAADRAAFDSGVRSLLKIKSIEAAYIGVPASTQRRPVVDSSYSVGLTIIFKDGAAHDRYQIDPIHLAFVDSCKHLWSRVQIYDSES